MNLCLLLCLCLCLRCCACQGKTPFYLSARAKKELVLQEQFKNLEAKGPHALDKFLEKCVVSREYSRRGFGSYFGPSCPGAPLPACVCC